MFEGYFRPKGFEFDGRLYERLGVIRFKRLLMRLARVDPERPTASAYVLGGRRREDIRAFERRSRRSEVIHLLGLLAAAVMLAFGAVAGSRGAGVAGITVLAANFHCFILQRYNRVRIERLLQRERRAQSSPGPAPGAPEVDGGPRRA